MATFAVTGTSDADGKLSGNNAGSWVRGKSTCRSWVGTDEYPAEPNRYHLYVGINCPWCHRVMLARSVLGLDGSITMDVCFPSRTDEPDSKGRVGLWQFVPDELVTRNGRITSFSECTADTVSGGAATIVEIYDLCGVDQKSVPILFDKKSGTIVNNESAEIIRMLGLHATTLGSCWSSVPILYPEEKRPNIDEVNDWVYHTINNGAYKAGFSSSQDAYEMAYNGK